MNQLAKSQVAGNPWLAWMLVGGSASALIGLATVLVVQADKTCPSNGCAPVGFTSAQVVGLGLIAIGLLSLTGWLAMSALCWQLERQRESAAQPLTGEVIARR